MICQDIYAWLFHCERIVRFLKMDSHLHGNDEVEGLKLLTVIFDV
jgi:hypothetical protein